MPSFALTMVHLTLALESLKLAAQSSIATDRTEATVLRSRRCSSEHVRWTQLHWSVLDSDGQHEAADIPEIVENRFYPERPTSQSALVSSTVAAARTCPHTAALASRSSRLRANLSSDLGIKDTQSGFRAFSSRALDRLRFDSEGMELSLEMLEDAREKQLSIIEVPTVIRYGCSKRIQLHCSLTRFHRSYVGHALSFTKEAVARARPPRHGFACHRGQPWE